MTILRCAVFMLSIAIATDSVARAADPASARRPAIVAVDSLVVDVLSDDVSDTYVTKTSFATSELSNVVAAGATVVSGETLCVANLGYGLRLRTRVGNDEHVLLFDVGTEGNAFLHNCRALGVDLAEVEAIAITHGHWDHMGALPKTLPVIVAKRGRGRVAVHVNPDMFVERGLRLPDGRIVPADKVISAERMEEAGDPLLMDERMMVVHVKDLGLVVFSACSHAGIVNVCTEVGRLFPGVPIHAILGGLHLGGVMERIIPETVAGLQPFDIQFLIPGHCTGWRAVHALANAYGDRVSQSAIGTTYRFAARAAATEDVSPR